MEEFERSFNTGVTETVTPDISFDTSPNMSTNELYSPTEFSPLDGNFEDPPSNAPSPSSLGSPPPRILIGNASRFISGNTSASSGTSLHLESPEREREKVGFFSRKRQIKKPLGFDSESTDWLYNKYLRAYEFKPGMDIYSTKICQFEIEIMESQHHSEENSD